MADELNVVHIVSFVPVDFERKNRQQEIHVALDLVHASRTPRPQLRTDVIDHFQPRRCRADARRRLNSGQSTRTTASGARSMAAALSSRKALRNLGKTRPTSTIPMMASSSELTTVS